MIYFLNKKKKIMQIFNRKNIFSFCAGISTTLFPLGISAALGSLANVAAKANNSKHNQNIDIAVRFLATIILTAPFQCGSRFLAYKITKIDTNLANSLGAAVSCAAGFGIHFATSKAVISQDSETVFNISALNSLTALFISLLSHLICSPIVDKHRSAANPTAVYPGPA
jgi:hypothetical protein